MKKYQLLLLLFAGPIFLQCKKDKQETHALTTNTWKRGLTDNNISSNPSGSIVYSPVLNCEKDDELKFNTNGTLIIKKGSDKCDPEEPATASFNYTFNRASKELVIDSIKYTLVEETQNQIKYFAIVPSPTGFNYVVYLLVRP